MKGWAGSRVLLRAPARALHPVSVFAAVLVATLVLALTAAAAPLFVGSTSSASVSDQVAARCPAYLGVRSIGEPGDDRADRALLGRLTASIPSLGPLTATDLIAANSISFRGNGFDTTVIARPQQEQHITMVTDSGKPGLLVPDGLARNLGVHVGDPVQLLPGQNGLGSVDTQKPAPSVVAGIYRDLNTEPRRQFWCDPTMNVYGHGFLDEHPPPPITLVRGAPTTTRLVSALGAAVLYERPIDTPLTLATARRTLAGEQRLDATMGQGRGQFLHRDGATLFPAVAASGSGTAELSFVVRRANDVATTLDSASAAIAGAGSALALLLVAGCGVLWADRRRAEVRLLATRGVSVAGIAVMAVGEMLAGAVVGTAAGWALARLVVPLVGPSRLEPAAQSAMSGERATAAFVATLVVLFASTALAMARAGDTARISAGHRRMRAIVRWAPIELLVAAAAGWTYHRAASAGLATFSDSGIPHLRAVDLLFPILAIAAGGLLVARLVVLTIARRRPTRAIGWFLARRRLAGAPRVPAVLLASAALAVGVLVFSLTITATLRYTVQAKVKVFVGTTAVVSFVERPDPLPPALRTASSAVTRADDVQAAGQAVDVLAVDPATFASAAFWDPRFADRPLPSLLALLHGTRDGRVPALVVGNVPDEVDIRLPAPDGVTDTLPVLAAARLRVFPGEGGQPLVVIARSEMPAGAAKWAEDQLWLRDFGTAQRHAVGETDVRRVITTDDVDQVPTINVITWAYGFFESLGIVVAVIAFGGLLLYLATRQRARMIAYTLARRMGLRKRTHWWSLVCEIAVGTITGAVTGFACAVAAARIVAPHLDPQPGLPPAPLFVGPWTAVGAVLAGVLLATLAAASLGQHQADRSRAAEVLRGT